MPDHRLEQFESSLLEHQGVSALVSAGAGAAVEWLDGLGV